MTVQEYLDNKLDGNKTLLADLMGVHRQNVDRYLNDVLIKDDDGSYRLYRDVGRTLPGEFLR